MHHPLRPLRRTAPFALLPRFAVAASALVAITAISACNSVLGLDTLAKSECAGPCADAGTAAPADPSEGAGEPRTTGASASSLDAGVSVDPRSRDGSSPLPGDAATDPTSPAPDAATAPACGDGVCNGTETCSTCSADCMVCPRPFTTITDAFDTAVVNSALWSPFTQNGAAVAAKSLALEIVPGTGSSYAGVRSRLFVDATGRETRVEARQAAGPGQTVETFLELTVTGGQDHVRVGVSGGLLVFEAVVAGVTSRSAALLYDAPSMRWWRIWESAGVTQADYAALATGPWMKLASVPNAIPMTKLDVSLIAGTYATASVRGAAIFDNLNR